MRLEHVPPEKLKKDILFILGKHLNLDEYRVFFFGSRVNETSTERSDIDVGIEGPPIPSAVWFDIREAFVNFPILYKIEIVDFNKVSSRFRDVALEATEEIWNPYAKLKI